MTLHWYVIQGKETDPERLLTLLAPLNIREVMDTQRHCTFWLDEESEQVVKGIGYKTVNAQGRITARPYRGATKHDRVMLLRTAERAFREPPSKSTGWSYRRRSRGNYWITDVVVAVHPDDPVGRLVSAALLNGDQRALDRKRTEALDEYQLAEGSS